MIGKTSYELGLETNLQKSRASTLHILEKRFGPITPAARQQILEMTMEQLLEFNERLVFAQTYSELGLE